MGVVRAPTSTNSGSNSLCYRVDVLQQKSRANAAKTPAIRASIAARCTMQLYTVSDVTTSHYDYDVR
jgi:hypothetical protein